VLDICRRGNASFTFITPFVTDFGIARVYDSLCLLYREAKGCEVVVNDWGVFELLHKDFKGAFIPVLGRLLVRQYRDPRVLAVIRKQPPIFTKTNTGRLILLLHKKSSEVYKEWVKSSYVNSSSSMKLLSDFGVKRLELNNLIQGLNLKKVHFKKSLYTPYVNISTTRFCPMDSRRQRLYRINTCRRECQSYYELLQTQAQKQAWRILKRGNTIFYENPFQKKNFKLNGIDRIVYQPELPF
jgi:hypothetical protein